MRLLHGAPIRGTHDRRNPARLVDEGHQDAAIENGLPIIHAAPATRHGHAAIGNLAPFMRDETEYGILRTIRDERNALPRPIGNTHGGTDMGETRTGGMS